MAEATPTRLPRGRHQLSRDEVETSQRLRILAGMADAMAEQGYVATSVADVLKRAGVSRETFYRFYDSKLDCFISAFELAGELLVARLQTERSQAEGTDRWDRFDRVLGAYLDALAAEPAYARLFLVEVFAAGPEAMARRGALQQQLVDALADLLGARSAADRFACQMIVSATSSLVTAPLVAGDIDAIRALARPISTHARRLFS